MELSAGAAGAAAAAFGVPLVMRALARIFPAAEAPETHLTLDELKARYRWWELGISLAALAGAVPAAFALWLALRGVAALHRALLPAGEIVWVTGSFYWAVPALLLALTLMLPIFTWVSRRLLRERYPEYCAYLRLKTGMDVDRVARLFGVGVSVACAAFIFLGLDWWVRVAPDGLTVNRYLGIGEERHAFRDIRRIRTAPALVAPNGNVVARREFVVVFADGSSWSTNNGLSDPSPDDKLTLALILADRSGAEVEEVQVLRNEEL